MSIVINKCVGFYNGYCKNEKGTLFFRDKHDWVKAGDIVKTESDSSGFYRKIWVNDVLKTENYFGEVHNN